MGVLVVAWGATFLLFWRLLATILEIASNRFAQASGRLAQKFFRGDRDLVALIQFGESWVWLVPTVGFTLVVVGVLMAAFPRQTEQVLRAVRVI
jgi:hypothetical protein